MYRGYRSRGSWDGKGLSVMILTAILAIVIGIPTFTYGSAVWKTGFTVAIHQPFFYLMMLFVFVFAVFWKFFNHKIMGGDEPGDVTWLETSVHVLVGLAINFSLYAFFIFSFGGIKDTCLFNATVIQGIFEEHYTTERDEEICDSRDTSGNCTSSHTVTYCDNYHGDAYSLLLSNGKTLSVSAHNYRSLVKNFGNEKEVPSSHFRQCSMGDGREFRTKFVNGKSQEISACYEEFVMNYVKGASHNIHKKSQKLVTGYEKLLRPIPGIKEHILGIGPFDSDRLIVAGIDVPAPWKKKTEEALDIMNGRLGPRKEINAILYVVNTNDQSFKQALEAYWCYGAKNQLTIIIGCSSFPKIDWVGVIDFWGNSTSNIEYDLRDNLGKMSLTDDNLIPEINKQINKSWKRKEMKELEYLAREISLSGKMILINLLIIVVLNLIFAFVVKKFE